MPLSILGSALSSTFFVELVSRHGAPALILGAGNGALACDLASHACPVLVVESNEALMRAAEERRASLQDPAAVRLVLADPRSLRLAERFPVVIVPAGATGLMRTPDELTALLLSGRHHLTASGALSLELRMREPAVRGPSASRRAPHLRTRDGGVQRLRLGGFTTEDLERSLLAAGLVALERYGDYSRRPFDPGEDPVSITVAGLESLRGG